MSTFLKVLNDSWIWLANLKPVEWIGIAGFVIASLNFWSGRRRAARDPQRQEVLAIIERLHALCDQAADEIERHLCFHETRKAKEEIYRILGAAKRELNALENRLPCRKDALFKAYTEWYMVVTGDGFPVDKKTCCFKSTDDRVQAIGKAESAFSDHLDRLRLECLSDRTRYWK